MSEEQQRIASRLLEGKVAKATFSILQYADDVEVGTCVIDRNFYDWYVHGAYAGKTVPLMLAEWFFENLWDNEPYADTPDEPSVTYKLTPDFKKMRSRAFAKWSNRTLVYLVPVSEESHDRPAAAVHSRQARQGQAQRADGRGRRSS